MGQRIVKEQGYDLLRNPLLNKGLAFTAAERQALGLNGLLPYAERTLHNQVEVNYHNYSEISDPDRKYDYLRTLQDRNETLFYALLQAHLEEMLPIVYTPTVGKACQEFSHRFHHARGVYLTPENIDQAEEILKGFRDIRLIVVTDNQGILGIGDQGAGGMGICIGKLTLYTAGAGIYPGNCLPISLDLGTNNKDLLEDPHYLGYRKPRLVGEQYDLFLERFARAVHAVFPKALVQWEDFSKQNAFTIVERYRDYLISFNDDIQGTGAVVLSAILAASRRTKRRVGDSVYVISGAGAGGMGVAKQIYRAMRSEGLNRFECYSRIWLTDSHGLLFHGRAGDAIEPYKRMFAHSKDDVVGIWGNVGSVSLLDVVKGSRCDVLIGLSGQRGQFTEEIVEAMLENSDTPLVMPCSNPTVNSEILPEDLYRLTHNKALCVSGSPFPEVKVDGVLRRTGQANNAFIFPGVGLGTLVSGARKVTEQMLTAASYALAELIPLSDIEQGYLMPSQSRLRECSVQVAMAVAEQAIKDGVAMPGFEVSREAIEKTMWSPVYETYEAQQS